MADRREQQGGGGSEGGPKARTERRVFSPSAREEVEEELSFHVAMRQRELMAEGLSAEEAEAEARRRFGDIGGVGAECRTLAQERDRARERTAWLRDAAVDIRYALRRLRRSPALTAAAVLTLGLGIGATTAIYSVIDAVLLRPLAFSDPDALVVPLTQREGTTDRWAVSFADYEDWRAAGVFEAVALYRRQNVNVAGDADSERVDAAQVTETFFSTLRVVPEVGGLFTAADHAAGATRRALVSHGLWQRAFGGDPGVVGRTVELGGRAVEIAGVLPAGHSYPLEADVWFPLQVTPELRAEFMRRDNFVFSAIARLRPDRSAEQTSRELAAYARRVAEAEPAARGGITLTAQPLVEHLVGTTATRTLWILLGAVALLLVIACVNVANLLLARSAERERELALRSGLGASRGRLGRQLITEGVVLALLGGAFGVLLAQQGVALLVSAAPAQLPRLDEAGISASMLVFACAVSLLSAVLFGLAPALRLSRASADSLTRGAQRMTAGPAAKRRRDALVVAELALSVVLLVGAALLLRSFANLRATDPGFETDALLTFSVSLQGDRYPDAERRHAAFRMLRERLEGVGGVQAVSLVSSLPLGGGGSYLGRVFLQEGSAEPPEGTEVRALWQVAEPGYFEAMQLPVLRGRDFDARDTEAGTPVAIVSRTFARRMFGDGEAIGRRVRSWRDENVYREIVGVVDDVRAFGLEDEPGASFYVPHGQDAWSSMVFVVRARGDAAAVTTAVRQTLRAFDPSIAMAGIRTMHDVLSASLAPARFIALVLAFFGGAALLLVMVGVYGVIASGVAQRTREIGIRLALGAHRTDVLRMVAREAGAVIAVGILVGVLAALAATRPAEALLHDVSPTDPLTFGIVALLIVIVAGAASLVPARRAAAVEPMITLRGE